MRVRIENAPAFLKLSDCIAYAVISKIDFKHAEIFDQDDFTCYPCNDEETFTKIVTVVRLFELDDVKLICFKQNDKFWWTSDWHLI